MENNNELPTIVYLPTIVHENEDKTIKISYFGQDELFIQSKSGTVAVH